MIDDPRAALVEVIQQHGLALAEDARRTEAFLRDYCPNRKRDTFALVSAIRERVPADLLASKDSTPRDVLLPRLTARLSDELGLAEPQARWAVDSWALALGVLSEADLAIAQRAAPETRPPLAPPPPSPLGGPPFGQPPGGGVPAPTMPVLTVGRQDGERYPTITAALQDAWPGQRVIVRPGIYRESLNLVRPVEIIADGDPGGVILESAGPPCLIFQAETALVRGLSLRQTAGASGQPAWAVDILTGRPVLEDCRITIDAAAPWSAAIMIHGPTADPTIRRCTLADLPCSALLVSDRARGTLEDCSFIQCGQEGMPTVVAMTGAQTALVGCRVERAGAAAVWCGDGGALRLDGCQIDSPAGAGIEVAGGAPTVRRSRMLRSRGAGVTVVNGGRGNFEDCEISASTATGVSVAGGSTPTFRRCTIQASGADGVTVTDSAWGTFEDCQILDANGAGLQVARGGNPRLRRCRLSGAKTHAGVLLWAGGQAGLEECEVTGNHGSGVEVRQGATVLLRRCVIHANGGYGVLLAEASSGTVERCTLRPNPQGSWFVQPGCQLRQSANLD